MGSDQGTKANKWLAILNPNAGNGRAGKQAPDALARLRRAGLKIDVLQTTGPKDATAMAAKGWADGYERFISLGGDGTTYEVVNGLFADGPDTRTSTSTAAPPILGILPLGTGNSFLMDFGITDLDRAIGALTGASHGSGPRPVDVVRAEHTEGVLHFINLLSVGFTADVGALTNAKFKSFGALGYIMAVVVSVANLDHPTFPMATSAGGDFDRRPCTFVSFSNSRFTGGSMKMAPTANVADGLLDVVRMGAIGRGALLGSFPRIFKGDHQHMAAYENILTDEVRFELAGPVDVMVDGEIAHIELTRLKVLPRALRVMA